MSDIPSSPTFDLQSARLDVLAYLRRVYPQAPDALREDACQEALLRYWCRRDTLDAEPIGWLCVVARREALREILRGKRHASADRLAEIGWQAPDPHDPDAHREACDALRMLGELRPLRRRALLGRIVGLSYLELADATNATYTATNRHVTEARGELRALLG